LQHYRNVKDGEEIVESYIYSSNGEMILQKSSETIEIPSLIGLRSDQFYLDLIDQILSFKYDINNDGKLDKLEGKLWLRWGNYHVRNSFG
jgi:hypothetical protein